jgi:hypothetical protein
MIYLKYTPYSQLAEEIIFHKLDDYRVDDKWFAVDQNLAVNVIN